jgi:RNA polymerase sigma-70 factor (ECF subfamily)
MSVCPGDGQLVAKLQSGDLDVLGVLYERHKLDVYRTALAITDDPAAAESILQDCFLRLHECAHDVDGSLPLRPWLYRALVELAYDWERSRQRWRTPLGAVMNWLTSLIRRSPEWRAEMRGARGKVMNAISLLDVNQRIVVILFYLNSLSVKEIASILECPADTVESRLRDGRENLQRRLGMGYNLWVAGERRAIPHLTQ